MMLANCRAMTPEQKLEYGNLNGGGFKQRLLDQFTLDTQPPPDVVDVAEIVSPHHEDPELLERERTLQEHCSIQPVRRSKDVYHTVTHDMTWT